MVCSFLSREYDSDSAVNTERQSVVPLAFGKSITRLSTFCRVVMLRTPPPVQMPMATRPRKKKQRSHSLSAITFPCATSLLFQVHSQMVPELGQLTCSRQRIFFNVTIIVPTQVTRIAIVRERPHILQICPSSLKLQRPQSTFFAVRSRTVSQVTTAGGTDNYESGEGQR